MHSYLSSLVNYLFYASNEDWAQNALNSEEIDFRTYLLWIFWPLAVSNLSNESTG